MITNNWTKIYNDWQLFEKKYGKLKEGTELIGIRNKISQLQEYINNNDNLNIKTMNLQNFKNFTCMLFFCQIVYTHFL